VSHVLRHFCIGLSVAILVALNLHGVVQSQHEVAHAADWPAVALADTDTDTDHHDAHVHVAPSDVPDPDTDQDADREQPLGHHHHGGADAHAALPTWGRGLTEGPTQASAQRRAGSDRALSGLPGDGPEYPPKRMRTVV
jgi:hypothetical protein